MSSSLASLRPIFLPSFSLHLSPPFLNTCPAASLMHPTNPFWASWPLTPSFLLLRCHRPRMMWKVCLWAAQELMPGAALLRRCQDCSQPKPAPSAVSAFCKAMRKKFSGSRLCHFYSSSCFDSQLIFSFSLAPRLLSARSRKAYQSTITPHH